ncbi:MAG: cupin domain-containing protein [Candidatus Thalassarchaeum sp.]|jgi:hypothetical protein|uniref:Cupin 2 domain-containing protein n=1 Tax=uncultured marine group II/III euryarchaeote AD1000_04_H02 TaxID=1457706 RepID=A0A075FM94_9EURY|nr:cupin 2 domain-containing protein [uncultured marine group II/III euryarchaeote AD1000_04_H02]MDP6563105.1 cupin domain-containing protein [Candidatus Thalassarchaeum sp.]MDP6921002.1 cupin domain-containing protein [Candidatus Thalassarchaeum sp.]GIT75391.1 MAG: cupin [Euryarchaeota archaeon]|tara:strand:- start:68 stop:427 length:360 start_codon:yes stop_codon:yes gene_type:complete
MNHDIILKRFEEPDELREFEKGRFEVIHFDGMTIGRATYNPGWKWSVDVSPLSGTDFCEVEHLGMVLEGHATCAFKDGEVYTLGPGDLFYIGPEPHDSWVVGDEKYVSLHFQGADKYAD